ncbi:MAG: hypothetical protein V4674_03140 [Patescibacteria group bacterium]
MSLTTLLLGAVQDAFAASAVYLPFAFVFISGFLFWELWVRYVQQLTISKTKFVLLEIKIPKESPKNPKGIEVVIGNAMFQTSPSNWWDWYYLGKIRPWWTLEIASIEGELHFYVYTPIGFRNLIESQLYAQYPAIEIHEAEDYTPLCPYTPDEKNWEMWATHYKTKAKAGDVLPIKTYIEWGLDKDPKEEFKIDPLSQIVEFMGTMGPGENFWFQILLQAHDPKPPKPGDWPAPFSKRVEEFLREIRKINLLEKKEKEGKTLGFLESTLSTQEKEIVEATERKASKRLFDVGIRSVYLARKGKFTVPHIASQIGLLRVFGSNAFNDFSITNYTGFDIEAIEDPFGIRRKKRKQQFYEEYSKRGFFFEPYIRPSFVLSNEELATLWHIPGASTETPTLSRIESKKSEAPVNLPI